MENNEVEVSKHDRDIELTLPKEYSNQLAELIGILTGDGYMNNYGSFSLLEIAGDSRLDHEYLTSYVTPMIEHLFNLKSKIYVKRKQNAMYLRLMSKGLNNYLLYVDFKRGKKEQITVPSWILNNNEYMKFFIRGLVDTDGSLVLLNRNQKKYRYYPRIQIASKSKPLISSVGKWLRNEGLSLSVMVDNTKVIYKGNLVLYKGYRIQISGRKELIKWMKLIGFRNKRHLDKYQKYKSGSGGI
ncbi:MAG TPA: LAGLIDADG family homing endonuclease [Candidatus Nanoarchaeia archaeon]|nr:LAGLIDADG family homing endonuclease [Candidatus Nanoarchaeia archaeon]